MSGEDAGLISAQARDPQLGFVGDVAAVNPDLLPGCWPRTSSRSSPPSAATRSGQAYNINADTAAGALAEAVQRQPSSST